MSTTSVLPDVGIEIREGYADVGGDVISAGGTGTFAVNTYATEIQAGSYALMDTAYAKLDLPFVRALTIVATVIHANDRWSVADCGLKALGMDHGDPTINDAPVLFVSDEHVTFVPEPRMRVGDRVLVRPAHVDPTVAYHERMHLADGPELDAPKQSTMVETPALARKVIAKNHASGFVTAQSTRAPRQARIVTPSRVTY
jgi:D-serine deaminase-like pyridoxal phosphate-dependent protein